jgi:hypothetical protein
MSDEKLRELQRAAATDESLLIPYAEALARAGRSAEARATLAPRLTDPTKLGALARRRALALAAGANDTDGATAVALKAAEADGAVELVVLIRETPTVFMAARVVLVRALRAKDKHAANRLARELPGDPLAAILFAEGEIVM